MNPWSSTTEWRDVDLVMAATYITKSSGSKEITIRIGGVNKKGVIKNADDKLSGVSVGTYLQSFLAAKSFIIDNVIRYQRVSLVQDAHLPFPREIRKL